MINWKFTNQHKDGFNYPKYISEDVRFIIIKEKNGSCMMRMLLMYDGVDIQEKR